MHEDDHESLPDPTGTRPVERLQAGRREPHVETLAEELPVALVYNGISHAVMLASPADLEDFALGFSLSEGIIDSPDDLLDVEILPGGPDIAPEQVIAGGGADADGTADAGRGCNGMFMSRSLTARAAVDQAPGAPGQHPRRFGQHPVNLLCVNRRTSAGGPRR